MKIRTEYWLFFLRRKAVLAVLACGILIGFLAIGLVRSIAMQSTHTHYHADFAVFIRGQRQEFKGPQYYQEVSACDAHDSPLGRVHLHDENNHVVHVHADVVTWADLFTNLGWSLSNSMLYDGETTYADGQGGNLHFVLNGKATRSIANEIIGDQDRLLISYGAEDDGALMSQFGQVESGAKKADNTADPAACQGPEQEDLLTHLRRAFLW